MRRKNTLIAVITVLSLLLIDQIVKFWVKLSMFEGQQINVFADHFYIHFTENPGMAFGMEFGGNYGKLFLSVFRLFAIGGIAYVLYTCIKRDYHSGFVFCISLILAGAAGNMIDCTFYGIIFNRPPLGHIATLFPKDGGYSTFLYGDVVDMIYFPLFEGTYPEWIPKIGGSSFSFFNAIFNIADSAITIGVIAIILFQGYFFKNMKEEETHTAVEPAQSPANESLPD